MALRRLSKSGVGSVVMPEPVSSNMNHKEQVLALQVGPITDLERTRDPNGICNAATGIPVKFDDVGIETRSPEYFEVSTPPKTTVPEFAAW